MDSQEVGMEQATKERLTAVAKTTAVVGFRLIVGAVIGVLALRNWAHRTYTTERAEKVRRQQEEAEAARLQGLLRR
ncbi:MAG: hypothetical protein IT406_01085 [Candidatus Yanofskybacteria bacterium]|nr:hypothetical protein [Candidatus Yanofskybacteria bacterium]